MRFEQTKDILEHAQQFYKLIADYYHSLSEQTQHPRLKMLLDYLSRHEEHLQETLAEFESGASEHVLNTWFKSSPCEEKLGQLRTMMLKAELTSVDEITDVAMKIDDCLIGMYKKLAETAEIAAVKDAFSNLVEMEEHEKIKSMRNILMMQDL